MKAKYDDFKKTIERTERSVENIRAMESIILAQNWPPDTEYSHEPLSDIVYRVWIHPFKGDERECLRCCTRITGKMEAKFREKEGYFYYYGEKNFDNFELWLMLENADALRPQCRIEAYQETVTKYKSVCDDGSTAPTPEAVEASA